MRRALALTTVLFLLFSLACCPPKSSWFIYSPSSLVRHLGSSTVALYHPKTNKLFCTGTWVSQAEILTAAHCVSAQIEAEMDEDDESFSAQDPPKSVWSKVNLHYYTQAESREVGQEPTAVHLGTVVKWSHLHDLALVVALPPYPEHSIAPVPDTSPAVGDELHFMGHTKSMGWTYVRGYVSAYRNGLPNDDGGPYLEVQASIYFGNSGGGCFDKYGSLVGVADFLSPAPGIAFCVALGSVRMFLDPKTP